MWVLLLLGSLGYGSYVVYKEVDSFSSYPVVSLTRINYVKSIDFPQVIVCNLNPFANEFAKTSVLTLLNGQLYEESNRSKTENFHNARYYSAMSAITLNDSTLRKFGLRLNETLISCIFSWSDCSLDQDFVEFYNPYYGNCFRYNFKKSKKVSFSGSLYGLRLQLVSNPMESQNSLLSMYSGFTVYVK